MSRIADLTIRETLLEPELVLPSQVNDGAGGHCQGERSLMFEILASALHDLDSPVIRVREDAERWLLSPSIGLVTCRDACDFLLIEYESLRSKVEKGMGFLRHRRGKDPESFNRALERAPTRDRRFYQVPLLAERES